MIDALTKKMLDIVAQGLPMDPPLRPENDKDATVRDFLPELSEEELDYIMTQYTGSLERG